MNTKRIKNLLDHLKSKNVIIRDVKKYRIIYINEKILILNTTGKLIVNYLIRGFNEEEIVKKIATRYKIKGEIVKNDLNEFIQKLENLIKKDDKLEYLQ